MHQGNISIGGLVLVVVRNEASKGSVCETGRDSEEINRFLVGAGGGVLSKKKEKRGEGSKERKLANLSSFRANIDQDDEV